MNYRAGPPHVLTDSWAHDPDDIPEDLTAAARRELAYLWVDLLNAELAASDPPVWLWSITPSRRTGYVWSAQCMHLAARILTLTRLVGTTSWRELPPELSESGLYERLHREWGIEYEAPDMEAIEAMRTARNAHVQ